MTTLQNKEEHGKGPMKSFAPPAKKLRRLTLTNPNSLKEDTLGITSSEGETKPSMPKARFKKKEKPPTELGQGSGQKKKGKNPLNKQAEKEAEKERTSLTNEEYEEIFQIVLQKSREECLGSVLDFAETSCAQPIGGTQTDKELGIASNTANIDNLDGRLIVPYTPENPTSQENGVVSEINANKPGQPHPVSSEKKCNKLCLNKRKKNAQNGKLEISQGGHEHRQEDQPKNSGQDHAQITEQLEGDKGGFGQYLVWVQCSSPNCEKWRRLCRNMDPSILPSNWSCDQNTDLEYNRCDIPEETWTGHESDVAYASYIPGSIIWAKQYGYPWWPGMVEPDPDLGEYFLFASHLDCLPSKYHVTFFGEAVSRAWIPVNMLKNFQELSLDLAGAKKFRNKDYIQKLGPAVMMAEAAEQTSIQERVNLFGFHSRYTALDVTEKGKDFMPSETDKPDSCLEKEDEVESKIEQEEEKKDPTLPDPKPAKTQTKKSKLRGLQGGNTGPVDGQTGTLPKKTKRCLRTESAAPPVLIMAKKGDQGNSDSHQSDPRKKFKSPQSKPVVTGLSKGRKAKMVPGSLTPPTHQGPSLMVKEEGPGPQEPRHQGAASIPTEDEASSDLDLEQLLEDIANEPEPREASQLREEEGLPMALLRSN
ncbi:zinc finger CW-type PWWP domain protein 1 isoform X2 [Echinops telfairi]|uniref:Zinc finger CW-type PWWP domain protein 1 isoform X2 n=1 Tax=Echinops telfairi TaxID=9371 RepID=A0AC55CNP1_ECHTE|nr:zinc finger CW-type PWWP domain protein 1 isoform X2 [Echinops telfairi]